MKIIKKLKTCDRLSTVSREMSMYTLNKTIVG